MSSLGMRIRKRATAGLSRWRTAGAQGAADRQHWKLRALPGRAGRVAEHGRDCVRYRKNALGTCCRRRRSLADLSRILTHRRFLGRRIAGAPGRVVSRRVRLCGGGHRAIAVAVVCAIVYQLRETPSVHAAALLRKRWRWRIRGRGRAAHTHQDRIATIDARHRRRTAGIRYAGHRAAFPLGELQLGRPSQRKGFRDVARPTPGEADEVAP